MFKDDKFGFVGMMRMRLNEICEVYSGYALKSFNDSEVGLPVVKIGNILTDGTLNLDKCQYTTDCVNEKYYSNKDDIYIALSGATIGKIGIMDADERYVVNQRVGIVRKKSDDVPQEYIKYFLLKQTNRILQEAAGCAQPNISPKQIAEYSVPEVSKEKMFEVCIVLDAIKRIIDMRKAELIALDNLIKARFVEMFGDVATSNYKYETRKLGDVADVGSSHRVFTTEFVDSGIPFYRGTEIGELANGIKPTEPYYISEEHYNRLAKDDTKPQLGDLLMPSICNKGQVWMVDTNEPFYYKDGRVLCISPNRAIFDSKYLEYFMRVKTLVEYPKLGSGSTFAEFKIFLLKDIDVLIPPLELQNQFANFVHQVDKSKVAVQKALDEIQLLFDSLMQQYFG